LLLRRARAPRRPRIMPPKQQRPRSRGRGGGGGDSSNRRISHSLSWALRHAAPELSLPMTTDGYVPVTLLLEHTHPKLRGLSLAAIEQVVATNDKQRFKTEHKTAADFAQALACFQAEPTVLCIRANQGHSIPDIDPHALLQPLTADQLAAIPVIVHGTYEDAWRTIQQDGLSKMRRNHIHFAAGLPGEDGVISGMRKSSQLYIYINAAKCAQDGITFFQSDNGVLLTAGANDEGILPVDYFSHVTDKAGKALFDRRSDA
jgi:2'-phosphotransferase